MAPPSGVIPDDDPLPPPRPSSSRSVLGQVGGGGGLSSVAGATPVQPSSQRISRGTNGSKLEIFSDASGAAADPEASQWEDFGTRDGRRKENHLDATPWKGETLPQSAARHRVAPRTPKLEVFKDTSDNGAVRHADDAQAGLVIRAKAPLSEAEQLRDDPLKNYDTSNVSKSVPTLPPPPSVRKPAPKKKREPAHVMQPWVCPTGGPERPTAKGKIERCMFDWDATFKGGEEWSFQEVRAKEMGLFGREWKPLKAWEKGWHKPGATTPKKEVKKARPPSPTLNTKLANEEVMSLFNQTIHGGKVRDPDFDTDSDDDDDDDEEEADDVAPLPTPLPPRQPERQMLSMMTPGGMIPPTPTPAQGANARRQSPQMNVFADENATPAPSRMAVFADENATPAPRPQVFTDENAPSARKVNVFADSTPKPKPLGGRTPLAPSASKARAFGVLEEPATPSANIFAATPAPIKFASPIQEEDENAAQDEHSASSRKASPLAQASVFDENAAPSHKASPLAQVNVFDENAVPSRKASPLSQSVNVFDENAVPSRKASPLAQGSVFDEDAIPSRKSSPLAQSTGPVADENAVPSRKASPIAQSTASVFDENAGPSRRASPLAQSTGPAFDENAVPSRKASPIANGNVFDENVPLRSSPFEPVAQPQATEPEQGQYGEYEDYYTDEEPGYGRPMKNFDYKSIMTPVTERTENTIFVNQTMRSEMLSEAEEEDEEERLQSPHLTAVAEVDEPPSRSERRESGHSSHGSVGNCSGSIDTGAFQIPDGYTIHPTAANTTLGQLHDETGSYARVDVDSELFAAPAEPASSSEILSQIPNPCCPTDDSVVATLLSRMDPPFVPTEDQRSTKSGRLSKLQAAAKTRARRSSSMSRSSLAPQEDAYHLSLGKEYEMREKLGEGGFGAVFAAVDVAARTAMLDRDEDESDDEVDETSTLVAIKVESPGSLWEAAMLQRVHSRLAAELIPSIIRPRGLHAYADESYLLLDFSAQGTLLDVVNKASVWGISAIPNGPSVPDEIVALFFTAELLRLLEGLHAQSMIHGDLKIDNCMVRLDAIPASEGGPSSWSTQYSRNGQGGWKHKGVRLIDFGRAQDLTLYDSTEERFTADWKTDERDCPAMRRGDPWSYDTDYFGLAGVCYCLLFGKYIATETDENGRVKVDQTFKRYWRVQLWTRVFDTLLNPYDDGEERGPILGKLRELREALEEWLEANCQKNGKSLKQLLKRIELRAMERR